MTQLDTTQTDMQNKVDDFSVDAASTEGVSPTGETFYDNPDFSENYGYYKEIPEYQKAIQAFATWTLGRGITAELARNQVILEGVTGRGDEDIAAILWNMKVMAKVNGDSYAEVMRGENGDLLNLKCLSPENIRVVFSSEGLIIRYEQMNVSTGQSVKTFQPDEILHFCNDRVADEKGGTAVFPAVKWSLDAKNEAMRDWRRISHRSTVRIILVDEGDTTRLLRLKTDLAGGINKGEVVLMAVDPKDINIQDLTLPPINNYLDWIRYLDNRIFLDIGVPKVIMGSSESIPESGGKISYVTYEQIYTRETRQMEADFWNQVGIRINIKPPVSIAEGESDNAAKNEAQTGFQPSDTAVGGLQ